jgi:hypothetical protein
MLTEKLKENKGKKKKKNRILKGTQHQVKRQTYAKTKILYNFVLHAPHFYVPEYIKPYHVWYYKIICLITSIHASSCCSFIRFFFVFPFQLRQTPHRIYHTFGIIMIAHMSHTTILFHTQKKKYGKTIIKGAR